MALVHIYFFQVLNYKLEIVDTAVLSEKSLNIICLFCAIASMALRKCFRHIVFLNEPLSFILLNLSLNFLIISWYQSLIGIASDVMNS